MNENRDLLEVYEHALAAEHRSISPDEDSLIRNKIAELSQSAADPQRSIELAERIVSISQAAEDRAGTALGLLAMGDAYRLLGESRRAIDLLAKALEIMSEMGNYEGQVRALRSLGLVQNDLGQPRYAIEMFEVALQVIRGAGILGQEALILNNIGLSYEKLGEPRRAIEFFDQALSTVREVGNLEQEAMILNNIGFSYEKLGEPRRAIEFLIRALQIMQETGNHVGAEYILDYLAGEHRTDEKNQVAQGASDMDEWNGGNLPSIYLRKKLSADMQRLQVNGHASPHFLKESLAPFLKAVSDLQHIIDELQNKPASEISIYNMNTEDGKEAFHTIEISLPMIPGVLTNETEARIVQAVKQVLGQAQQTFQEGKG